jgi:hypothetical protein
VCRHPHRRVLLRNGQLPSKDLLKERRAEVQPREIMEIRAMRLGLRHVVDMDDANCLGEFRISSPSFW